MEKLTFRVGGSNREEVAGPLHRPGSPQLLVQTAKLHQISKCRETVALKGSRLGDNSANIGILSQGERREPILRINYFFILLFYSLPERSAVQLN